MTLFLLKAARDSIVIQLGLLVFMLNKDGFLFIFQRPTEFLHRPFAFTPLADEGGLNVPINTAVLAGLFLIPQEAEGSGLHMRHTHWLGLDYFLWQSALQTHSP